MQRGVRQVVLLGALVVLAGCTGPFTGAGTSAGATATETPSTATDKPVLEGLFWVGGELVGANDSAIVVATGEGRVVLNTTHGVFFRSGSEGWTSEEPWTEEDTGVNVCVAVHAHEDGVFHVIKAFYDSTCSPTRS